MKIKSIKIKEEYYVNMHAGEFWVFSKNIHTGSVPGLPALGEKNTFLWGKVEEGLSYDELIEALAEKQDVDSDEAEEGVQEFLARLINGKIIDINN